MEKLTIEHLAPYLPFGLKFCNVNLLNTCKKNNQTYNPPTLKILSSQDKFWLGKEQDSRSLNDDIHKPILRPLSDLKTLDDNVYNNFTKYFKSRYDMDNWSYMWDVPYSDIERLFKLHFDIFRLIEKGLAISIHDIKE